eukprot:TRINITY_DN22438_c0_g2_i2.p1 TRINITY_DN22438_c0_g2~~TRINITY_DN22438_c0_g2_i2.p1  ORF type:complete len:548 (+),score=137.97 TRINITY_DN22438_c0_g2_i2:251-1894(+)
MQSTGWLGASSGGVSAQDMPKLEGSSKRVMFEGSRRSQAPSSQRSRGPAADSSAPMSGWEPAAGGGGQLAVKERGGSTLASNRSARRDPATQTSRPRHHAMHLEGSWGGMSSPRGEGGASHSSTALPNQEGSQGSAEDGGGGDGVPLSARASPDIQCDLDIQENIEEYAAARLAPAAKTKKEPAGKVHVNTMGEPIYKDANSYTIVECMQVGLRNSIESIHHQDKMRPLDPKTDFTIKAKREFFFDKSKKRKPEEAHMEPFTFTGYSPMCYRHIREFLGLDPDEFAQELCESRWTVSGAGKSSSLLYFAGTKYVIKTMNTEESKFLRRILHLFYHHIRNNPHTLLPKYYGHFSVTPERTKRKIAFVIMNNVFEAGGNKIYKKYDLKGSTVGRFAGPGDKILKDMDLDQSILVGPRRRRLMLGQIRRDAEFLKKCRIMDYSFLVGIHKPENPVRDRQVSRLVYHDERCLQADMGGMRAEGADEKHEGEVYYFGIIDILQEYNPRKQAENFVRGIRYDRDQISAVPPDQYAVRFCEYIEHITNPERSVT